MCKVPSNGDSNADDFSHDFLCQRSGVWSRSDHKMSERPSDLTFGQTARIDTAASRDILSGGKMITCCIKALEELESNSPWRSNAGQTERWAGGEWQGAERASPNPKCLSWFQDWMGTTGRSWRREYIREQSFRFCIIRISGGHSAQGWTHFCCAMIWCAKRESRSVLPTELKRNGKHMETVQSRFHKDVITSNTCKHARTGPKLRRILSYVTWLKSKWQWNRSDKSCNYTRLTPAHGTFHAKDATYYSHAVSSGWFYLCSITNFQVDRWDHFCEKYHIFSYYSALSAWNLYIYCISLFALDPIHIAQTAKWK